ncbi:MAG: hypothetical protein ACLQPV_09190 [Vulcanimicrobiaceae bacterium]
MRSDQERDIARFSEWVRRVHECLFEKLGGEEPAEVNLQRFGDGRFSFEITEDLGDITYVVDLPRSELPTIREVGPIEWRTTQPPVACAKLIAAYDDLKRASRVHA